jgi:predicted HAD superfamily Cof-like phosphohydrolase
MLKHVTNNDKVGMFMRSFGQDLPDKPGFPEHKTVKLRLDLIEEEYHELVEATLTSNLTGVADALGDLLYVVYGAGHAFGLNLGLIFNEIHRSNMSKLGDDGKPVYREDGKVMKGENFFEPNLERFTK